MKPWLQYMWKSLGPVGRIGAWLLLAALGLWLVRVLPAQRGASELENQLGKARQSLQRQASVKPRTVQDFYQHFPKIETLPDQLAKLDASAASVKLKISAAQYQLQAVSNLALQRYQVSLAIAGDYPSLRAFLNMAMNESGNAVFDETRFERDPKGESVTARVRISFYYQAPPAPPAAAKGGQR